jgi:hemoglobin
MTVEKSGETLFQRLGGEAGMQRILDRHYDRVLEDDLLREYFIDVDLDTLKARQLAFLRGLLGEAGARPDGAAMRAQHRDQLISELAFEGFIDTLVACAAETGAGAAEQTALRDALKSLRDSVITTFRPNPAFNYPTKPL